jgi:hypothetical protein
VIRVKMWHGCLVITQKWWERERKGHVRAIKNNATELSEAALLEAYPQLL